MRRPYNTYRNRLFINSWVGIMTGMTLALLFSMGYGKNNTHLIRPQVEVLAIEPQPTPTLIPSRQEELENLKKYLKTVFGKEWKVAFGVAQSECNSSRPEWPKCKLSWRKEHSIGWFQINLAQEEGLGAKVHWDKVPGKTLREKEEWLENPYNSVLIAKFIYDQSGFYPWTAYTNNNYLRTLPK